MILTSRNVGKMLKEAREKKNLTQKQLATKVGKKRSYISRVETAYGKNIKLQTLIELVENGLDGEVQISIRI